MADTVSKHIVNLGEELIAQCNYTVGIKHRAPGREGEEGKEEVRGESKH